MGIVTKELKKYQRDLQKAARGMEKAEVRAVRKTGITVRKSGSQKTREILNITAKTFNDAVKMRSAERKLTFTTADKPLALRLSPGIGYRARRVNAGIVFNPYRKGSRRLFKSAFSHASYAGGRVFKRKGRERLPIGKVFGPPVLSAFRKRAVEQAMDSTWQDRIEVTLRQEEAFVLSKL